MPGYPEKAFSWFSRSRAAAKEPGIRFYAEARVLQLVSATSRRKFRTARLEKAACRFSDRYIVHFAELLYTAFRGAAPQWPEGKTSFMYQPQHLRNRKNYPRRAKAKAVKHGAVRPGIGTLRSQNLG